jgi:beta-1,4-mannosyl-glycoprotein beta-1,4-N-acetylglucosaminyltransferase
MMPAVTRTSIIDAFTFFNEAEICELRLRVLDAVVDTFVVVEADATHSGRRKSFNFPALLDTRLRAWRDKILFHPMHLDLSGLALEQKPAEFDPATAHWTLEKMQRNGIDEACRAFAEDDWLVISDVDEIPHPQFLQAIVGNAELAERLPVALQQFMFYYKLTSLRKEDWRGSVVTTVGKSRALSAQWHRSQRWAMSHVEAAGWHLSFFGSAERIRTKIESFAHQEYNVDSIKSDAHIERSRAEGRDLMGRAVEVERVDETFFPSFFVEATANQREFFW